MMARGLRPEVRNDRPPIGESYAEARQRRTDAFFERSKPSANKPKFRRKVPNGCVDVYRIHHWDGRRNIYHGIYRDEVEAYRVADEVWRKVVQDGGDRLRVYVDHKAATLIDGQFFIVNLDPIKFAEPNPQNLAALLRPAEEQTQ
jgi:hypothetical protein